MFRATLFDRQRTRWRASIEEARADAIARGWASRDDYPGASLYLGVGVRIEERSQEKVEKPPKPHPR